MLIMKQNFKTVTLFGNFSSVFGNMTKHITPLKIFGEQVCRFAANYMVLPIIRLYFHSK